MQPTARDLPSVRPRRLLWTALLLAGVAAVGAGAAAAATYRVELVVFAREDSDASPEEPARLACLERARPIAAEPGAAELPKAVPPSQLLLVSEAQAIRRRGSGLRLLVHAAWQQEIPDGKAGPWVLLPATAEVGGCLRAGIKKVPEVEIALAYLPDPEDQHRAQLKQQVRPGEVHYLDHPAVGVLLRLDPLGADAGATPAPATEPSAPAAVSSSAPATAVKDAPPGVIPPPPKKPFRW